MNPILKTTIIAWLSIGATACSIPNLPVLTTEQVKYLKLQQNVVIPANTTRVFFQNGEIIEKSGFNHYRQHCRLEINTLSEQPQTVYAEKNAIDSISWDEEMIAALDSGIQLASTDEHPPETMDLIHFWLDSKTQPALRRLTCAGSLSDGDPADAPHSYPPNQEIINQILGKYGQLSKN